LSGPYDFLPYGQDRLVFNMPPGDKVPPPAMEPIHFADGTAPPMLLLQGGKDELVNPANALELEEKICKAGGEAKAIIYPDRAHEGMVIALAAPYRWLAPVLRDSVEFFRQH
jgi:acetyl esterase/lipase